MHIILESLNNYNENPGTINNYSFLQRTEIEPCKADFKVEELKAISAYALYVGSSKLTSVLIQMKVFILRLKNYKFEDLLICHCECLEDQVL